MSEKGGCFGCKFSDPLYTLTRVKVKCSKIGKEVDEKFFGCEDREQLKVNLFKKETLYERND